MAKRNLKNDLIWRKNVSKVCISFQNVSSIHRNNTRHFKQKIKPVCLPFSLYYQYFFGSYGQHYKSSSFALVNRRENVNFMYGECILMAFLYTIYLKYEFILRWQSNIKWYVYKYKVYVSIYNIVLIVY